MSGLIVEWAVVFDGLSGLIVEWAVVFDGLSGLRTFLATCLHPLHSILDTMLALCHMMFLFVQ